MDISYSVIKDRNKYRYEVSLSPCDSDGGEHPTLARQLVGTDGPLTHTGSDGYLTTAGPAAVVWWWEANQPLSEEDVECIASYRQDALTEAIDFALRVRYSIRALQGAGPWYQVVQS